MSPATRGRLVRAAALLALTITAVAVMRLVASGRGPRLQSPAQAADAALPVLRSLAPRGDLIVEDPLPLRDSPGAGSHRLCWQVLAHDGAGRIVAWVVLTADEGDVMSVSATGGSAGATATANGTPAAAVDASRRWLISTGIARESEAWFLLGQPRRVGRATWRVYWRGHDRYVRLCIDVAADRLVNAYVLPLSSPLAAWQAHPGRMMGGAGRLVSVGVAHSAECQASLRPQLTRAATSPLDCPQRR